MLRAFFRRSPLLIFLVLFAFSFLVVWNITIHNNVQSSFAQDDPNAQITDLNLCIDPDINGIPNESTNQLVLDNVNKQTIYVCGYLHSNTSKSLAIFWLEDDNNKNLIYSPKKDFLTEPGFFFSLLKLDHSLAVGKYKVEIWDGHRKIMATVKFEVVATPP